MKTIKEVAEICNCSKTTVSRAIKELNIQTSAIKNKRIIDDTAAERLINYIKHYSSSELLQSQQNATENCNISEQTATQNRNTTQQNAAIATENRNAAQQNTTSQNKTQQAETETENGEKDFKNQYENSESNKILIELLKEQLTEKDKQIQQLIEQNKYLIQSNAFMLKQLEHKDSSSQEENNNAAAAAYEDIKQEQPQQSEQEPKSIKNFFKRFFR